MGTFLYFWEGFFYLLIISLTWLIELQPVNDVS